MTTPQIKKALFRLLPFICVLLALSLLSACESCTFNNGQTASTTPMEETKRESSLTKATGTPTPVAKPSDEEPANQPASSAPVLTKKDFDDEDGQSDLLQKIANLQSGIGLFDHGRQMDDIKFHDLTEEDTRPISAEELRQFARVHRRLEPLKKTYNQRMRHVQSAEEFYAIKKEADAAAKRTALLEGMDIEDYHKLTERLVIDAPLRDRLDAAMDSMR